MPVRPDGAGSSSKVRRYNVSELVLYAPNGEAVLKSGGYGPVCSALDAVGGIRTPKPFRSGGGEAMVKVCGVAVAMLPG